MPIAGEEVSVGREANCQDLRGISRGNDRQPVKGVLHEPARSIPWHDASQRQRCLVGACHLLRVVSGETSQTKKRVER